MSKLNQTLYCTACASQQNIRLIEREDTNDFGCPRCHSRYALTDSDGLIRTAQFGGAMGQPNSSFGPGSSPMFKSKNNRGQGFNQDSEQSLDTIMERTHNPAPLDPERNMEKRLQPFHVHGEEDSIPYDLSYTERYKLKRKQEIRRREKFYEDAAKRVDENSVPYIQAHFQPKPEQMIGREETLESRRVHKPDEPRDPREDQVPDQIQPERRHAYITHGLNTPFMDQDEDDGSDRDAFSPTPAEMQNSIPTNGPSYNSNAEMEDWLDKGAKEDFGGGTGVGVTTNMDYPQVDTLGNHSSPDVPMLPSSIPQGAKSTVNSTNVGIEQQLDELMKQKSTGTPKIGDPDFREDVWEGEGKEPGGIGQAYKSKATDGLTPMPQY